MKNRPATSICVLAAGLLVTTVGVAAMPAHATLTQQDAPAQRLSLADSLATWYALGLNAHHVCAGLWVVGRDHQRTVDAVIAQDITPFPAFRWEDDFTATIDEAARIATVTDPSAGSRSAKYLGDQGCAILPTGATEPYFRPTRVAPAQADPAAQDWPTGDRGAHATFDDVDHAVLEATLDWAFDDAAQRRPQNTRGIVIIHRGRIVAERYAPGWGPYTPQISWSMGKSIASTLIGVLAQRGALSRDDPAPVAAWQGATDPRRDIRIRDLLRMSSGLDFDNFGLSPGSSYHTANEHFRIYFDAVDVAAHSVNQPLLFEPGTVWRYRNSDPLTLMHIARTIVESNGDDFPAFPQRALFDRIGARSFVLETDVYGNFIVTGFDYGGTRDWARLGLLYLNDGVWEGERVLPEDWAEFVSTPAPGDDSRGYGGLFWLNRGGSMRGVPEDAYWMAGYMGQYTMVIPSRDVVIVRQGPSSGGDSGYFAEIVRRALLALPERNGNGSGNGSGLNGTGTGAGAGSHGTRAGAGAASHGTRAGAGAASHGTGAGAGFYGTGPGAGFYGTGLGWGLGSGFGGWVGPQEASFEPVQPELFGAGGTLVNAWADFDDDGDLDLFVGFNGEPNRLYRQEGGEFRDVAGEVGLAATRATRAAAWGDFDGDGDPDLLVGFAPGEASVLRLYRNEMDRFEDATAAAGLAVDSGAVRQPAWVDYDRDGDLDLFVAFRDGANRMFRNDGGRFTEVAADVGLADARRSVGAVWFDYDRDGDLDLYVGNMDGDANALFRNEGGAFTDVAEAMGLAWGGRAAGERSNGTVRPCAADVDNDGWIDLFTANYGPNGLFLNRGGTRFEDVSAAWGVAIDGRYDSCAFADFDNDGRLDVYVNGTVTGGVAYRDYLFRNTGSAFEDVTPENLLALDADHGAQWADFDRDGAVDLALTGVRTESMHLLLRNRLSEEDAARAVRVLVLDASGNPAGPGTEIRVLQRESDVGDGRGIRDAYQLPAGARVVDSGSGYNSQSVAPAHFGLPRAAPIAVEVTMLTPRGRAAARIQDIDPGTFKGRTLVLRVDENGSITASAR